MSLSLQNAGMLSTRLQSSVLPKNKSASLLGFSKSSLDTSLKRKPIETRTSLGSLEQTVLSKELANNFLPHRHPGDLLKREMNASEIIDTGTKFKPTNTLTLMDTITQIKITDKPYRNAKILDPLEPVWENDKKYIGKYTEVYRTPYEQEMGKYMKAKEKFIGGTFRSYSGIASQIPLRETGLVRPHGPFHDKKCFGMPVELKSEDTLLIYNVAKKNDPSQLLNGPWHFH